MKRILMVAPRPLRFELTQDESFLKLPLVKAKSFMLPLHIATIAGLTPEEFEVDLWDESVEGWIDDDKSKVQQYDLVGITGYTAHLPRAKAIAQVFRKQGIPVAMGGAGISTMPQRYRDDFDIFFLGEAELTWPQFLADWKNGSHQRTYRQVAPVDLTLSLAPRWDSITPQMENYYLGSVQTSRGCPFDCEFCDVSYLFGHRFRHKPIDKVLEEIATLERFGIRRIVFCDDNFYGNPRYTKELLRELIQLNRSFRLPIGFAGEASINIADDEEVLQLLADTNFAEIFIGIESPNKESLKETNKLLNYRRNLIEDIGKIQSYGMAVRGSLIVGFDHDDKEIFDQQFQFVQESFLAVPSIRVLMAPPGTRLWERLRKEGRLLKTETEGRYFGNPGTTNIIPKKMTRLELHSGYLHLIEKVYDWENFAVRIKGFVSNIKRRPKVLKQERQWKRLFRFIYFLFSSLDKKTRGVVLDIVWYTFKHAPFMLPRVVRIINRQYGYAVRPELREAIQGLINREKSGTLTLELEKAETLVPESFKETYEEIFPKIYEEVFRGIADKTRVEETVIEIFTEFLTRWRHAFDSFSPDHKSSLVEITNRTIREKNRAIETQDFRRVSGNEVIPDLKKTYLSDQMLKAIEQELLLAKR